MKRIQCPPTEQKLKTFTVRIPESEFDAFKKRLEKHYSVVVNGRFTTTSNFVACGAFDFARKYFEQKDKLESPSKK